jgi:hypothetical protein
MTQSSANSRQQPVVKGVASDIVFGCGMPLLYAVINLFAPSLAGIVSLNRIDA